MYQAKKQRKEKQGQTPHARLLPNRDLKSQGRASRETKKEDVSSSNQLDPESFEYGSPNPIKKTIIRVEKPDAKALQILSPTTASQGDDELSDKHSPKHVKARQYTPKPIIKKTAQAKPATPASKGRRRGVRSCPTTNEPPVTPPKPIQLPTNPAKPTKNSTSLKRFLEGSPGTPSKPPKKAKLSGWKPLAEQKKHKDVKDVTAGTGKPSPKATGQLSSFGQQLKQWRTLAEQKKKDAAVSKANTEANECISLSSSSSDKPVVKKPAISKMGTKASSKPKSKRLSDVKRLRRDAEAVGLAKPPVS